MANMNIQQIMQMINGNPQAFLQAQMQNNPQISQAKTQITNMMNSSGMSGKEFAMQFAKQNGIDTNLLLQLAQRLGVK